MNYPKNVKEIKNLNEFIRKAREFETDKYWSNILYDCSSANYADWTRKESRLKWKREMIQKYLDYKNSKSKKEEKALIDWNNYLTPEEVKKFLSKDDKVESAENIIYSKEFEPRYKDLHNPLQAKYKNSWTKKELVQDLNEFYNFGHLITENISERLILYHNTTNKNAIKINQEGIKVGQRLQAYSKSPEEGNGIWCSTKRSYGYGGATITFEIDENDKALWKANNTEYVVYRNIEPAEIIDIDLVISNIPCTNNHDTTVESDIVEGIESWGKDKLVRVLGNYPDYFVQPYNKEQLKYLIKTGNKYCKGKIKMIESKHKIEEKSRNELLAKTKSQTITRYNKAQEYKGFYIRGVDTDELLKKDSLLTINCQVGNYRDQVQMENMLYWVEYEIEERNHDLQVTTKYVTQALMDAIDGMNIKVNCECGDFRFRMAYQATKFRI